jgi:hypothetical protein
MDTLEGPTDGSMQPPKTRLAVLGMAQFLEQRKGRLRSAASIIGAFADDK